jgi:membrane-associated protein
LDFLHHPLAILHPDGIRQLIDAYGLLSVCAIVFLESGVFPMLPGDSLLVVCGIYASAAGSSAGGAGSLSLFLLLTAVPLCAIAGAQFGFGIGRWAGKGAYAWKDRQWGFLPVYRRSWLARTEDFYKRWGAFAVVAGRWVPFVRTGTPLLAGVTRMSYRQYVTFNIVGALSWIWSMVLVGYYLPPLMANIAPGFKLEENIDKIVLVVVVLSLLPVFYTLWKESRGGGSAAESKTKPAKSGIKSGKAPKAPGKVKRTAKKK